MQQPLPLLLIGARNHKMHCTRGAVQDIVTSDTMMRTMFISER